MNKLEQLRVSICEIDAELIALIAKRQQLVQQIGSYKKQHSLAVLDLSREALLREFHAEQCADLSRSPAAWVEGCQRMGVLPVRMQRRHRRQCWYCSMAVPKKT